MDAVIDVGCPWEWHLLAVIATMPVVPGMGTRIPKMGTSHVHPAKMERSPTRNVADALFSRTQQRVLSLLFGQPERAFATSELIALARSGSGAVQRELQRLLDCRLLVVIGAGRFKRYQANPVAPIFQELCSIVAKTARALAGSEASASAPQ